MLLSAETFTEVVSKLCSDTVALSGSERRKSPRVGVRAKIEVERIMFTDKGNQHYQVQVRDLSRSGIGFLQKTKIARGDSLRAIFDRNDGGMITAEYEVTHCHQLSPNMFLIGAYLKKISEFGPQTPEAIARRLAA